MWGIIPQQVHQTKVRDVNDLRLIDMWARMERNITEDATDQWCRAAYVAAFKPQEDIISHRDINQSKRC